MFNTPILFIIFNRPDVTQKVFNRIKEIKPRYLYVAADGPRNSEEKDICNKTKEIIDQVDWDCNLVVNYQTENLGCKLAVSGAISWFFEQVEEGIILEDDCLPDITFFNFCEEMLSKYKNEERIMHISGDNFQFGKNRTTSSYYFSYIAHIWGWATWKRAWLKYDQTNDKLMNSINIESEFTITNKVHLKYLINNYTLTKDTTWDYVWMLTVWLENGLAILPNINLVTNIGFGDDSTHTHNQFDMLANIPSKSMHNIVYNNYIKRHKKADDYTFKKILLRTNWIKELRSIIVKIIKKLY